MVHPVTTSDNEWQRVTASGTRSDKEWYNEWQRVTTSDAKIGNKWQWVTASDSSGTTNETGTVHFKEWMITILPMAKANTLLLQGMDGYN